MLEEVNRYNAQIMHLVNLAIKIKAEQLRDEEDKYDEESKESLNTDEDLADDP